MINFTFFKHLTFRFVMLTERQILKFSDVILELIAHVLIVSHCSQQSNCICYLRWLKKCNFFWLCIIFQSCFLQSRIFSRTHAFIALIMCQFLERTNRKIRYEVIILRSNASFVHLVFILHIKLHFVFLIVKHNASNAVKFQNNSTIQKSLKKQKNNVFHNKILQTIVLDNSRVLKIFGFKL